MAPKYKLTYFNTRGLGEPIRYMLAYGDIDYEDIRISFEEWPKLKADSPYGLMPFIEINGKVINQSTSICRYFAKQLDLAGKDEFEALQIDATADTIADLRHTIGDYWWRSEEKDKPKKREILVNETIPKYLSRFEKQVQDNNGYFVNGKLSYADLYLAANVEYLSAVMKSNILDGYPNLKALVEKVDNIPKIKAWINKRPQSYY
ncbi:hypothetical protein R5R35_005246 [Gryllus longicercus]